MLSSAEEIQLLQNVMRIIGAKKTLDIGNYVVVEPKGSDTLQKTDATVSEQSTSCHMMLCISTAYAFVQFQFACLSVHLSRLCILSE